MDRESCKTKMKSTRWNTNGPNIPSFNYSNCERSELSSTLTPSIDGIYFKVYTHNQEEAIMKTAKLFINGRSQAVRLPKVFRFEGNEVYIKKVAVGVLLISKNQSIWDLWERNLMKYEEPFIIKRNQPELQQERESLD